MAACAVLLAALLGCEKQNQAPGRAAVPSGPAGGLKDSVLKFTDSATDPENDDVGIKFAWGNGDTSGWSVWVQSDSPVSCSYAYGRSGTYQVCAQARDIYGLRSSWSDPLPVTIDNPYPPGTPSVSSGPSAGGRWAMLSFAATAADSGGDSIAIRFDWGDGDTSDWSEFVPPDDTVTLSHAWPDSGTFQIRAQARDEEDSRSAWSDAHPVTISTLRWVYQAPAPFYSSPAIGGTGAVYVGYDKFLVAFDTAGSTLGSYETDGLVSESPAIGFDGTVYFGSEDHALYALYPNCGHRWRFQTGGSIHSSPAVGSNGIVYVGCDDGCLYAVASYGTFSWLYQTDGPVRSSPAIGSDGTVYVGSDDSCLYAINPDSTLRWRYQTGGSVRSSPAIGADGTVYVGSDDEYLYALNPDGTLRWRYRSGNSVASSPAVGTDGAVYVGSGDSCLFALNSDGTLRWRCQTGGGVRATPAIGSDGTVYVGSDGEYLYALNPDGTVRWHYRTGPLHSSATIEDDGTVYVGSTNGSFYALWGSSPLASSPWPKFRHDNRNTGRVGGGR